MNKVILMGRCTKDADIRDAGSTKVGRFTLAVDRRFKREGDPTADFVNCVCFGKAAEAAEKYYKKGVKLAITGHIQTGSYTKQDGTKAYTTDVVIDEWEFGESKASAQQNQQSQTSAPQSAPASAPQSAPKDDFMSIPEGVDNELPFS